MLAFGWLTIPERSVARVTVRILYPLKFAGMAEDSIVKFLCMCTGWPENISLVITNRKPSGRGQGHVTS